MTSTARAQSAELLPFAVVAIIGMAIYEAFFQTIRALVPPEDMINPSTLATAVILGLTLAWYRSSVGQKPTWPARFAFAAVFRSGAVLLTIATVVLLMMEAQSPMTPFGFLQMMGIKGSLLEDASSLVGVSVILAILFVWEFWLALFSTWIMTRGLPG